MSAIPSLPWDAGGGRRKAGLMHNQSEKMGETNPWPGSTTTIIRRRGPAFGPDCVVWAHRFDPKKPPQPPRLPCCWESPGPAGQVHGGSNIPARLHQKLLKQPPVYKLGKTFRHPRPRGPNAKIIVLQSPGPPAGGAGHRWGRFPRFHSNGALLLRSGRRQSPSTTKHMGPSIRVIRRLVFTESVPGPYFQRKGPKRFRGPGRADD